MLGLAATESECALTSVALGEPQFVVAITLRVVRFSIIAKTPMIPVTAVPLVISPASAVPFS